MIKQPNSDFNGNRFVSRVRQGQLTRWLFFLAPEVAPSLVRHKLDLNRRFGFLTVVNRDSIKSDGAFRRSNKAVKDDAEKGDRKVKSPVAVTAPVTVRGVKVSPKDTPTPKVKHAQIVLMPFTVSVNEPNSDDVA